MVETIVTAAITAAITGFVAAKREEARFLRDFALDVDGARAAFMAERVVQKLLSKEKWKMRTFQVISDRLGGFADDELRRLLVRAGAIRLEGTDGEELWGLLSRNGDAL